MAVSIENANTVVTEDGDSYTPTTTGTDKLVLGFATLISTTGSQTVTTHVLGVNAFDDASTLTLDAVGSNTIYSVAGFITDGNVSATSQVYDIALSTGFDNHGTFLMTVSGAHQTAPIVSTDQIVLTAQADLPVHTFTATAGQLVVYMPQCTKAATITTPANASNGDVWVEQVNAPIIGGTINAGAVYTLEVSSDLTSETVQAGDNNSGLIVASNLWVVDEAAAAGVTGSGALASQSSVMSGTGLIEKTSSGSLISQPSAMSGAALIEKTSSGALTSQSSTMAGTGTVTAPAITGSGALNSQVATMTGTGTVIVPTLDDVNTNEITADGETGVTYTVTGFSAINGIKIKSGTAETDATGVTPSDFDIPNVSAYTIDTDGSPLTTASNAVVCEVTDGVATASLAITHNPITGWAVQEITGAVKTPGSVFENFIGTIPDTSEVYYPTADNTTVDATGILSTDSTSNIDMQYWDATLENWQPFTILISVSGSGSLLSQSASMSGQALINKTSTGVLISQSATMSGSGIVGDDIVGSGELIAQSAAMSGVGARELTSSGSLTSDPATMSGEGTVPQSISGLGALTSQAATINGVGVVVSASKPIITNSKRVNISTKPKQHNVIFKRKRRNVNPL